MKKIGVLLGLLMGVLYYVTPGFAQDTLAEYPTGKKQTGSVEKSKNQAGTLEEIKQKLDKLLSGQEDILKQLDEVKKELYIIKVRATKR